MRLLLIEDEELLGRATSQALERAGHAVDWVRSGLDSAAAAKLHEYDAILLDLGLPDIAGEAALKGLRSARSKTPVIVLTAREQIEDRVKLLDLGADDYMVKPVDVTELGARLRAVQRRTSGNTDCSEVQRVGPIELNQANRAVSWDGQPVMLTGRQYDVLEAIVMRRPRLVTRAQLEECLYGWGDEVDSNAIEVYIHMLRRKFVPGLIITVRGRGYMLGGEDLLMSALRKSKA
jgi:DNA-binding response OmpR family regulator